MPFLIGFRRDDFVWSVKEVADPQTAILVARELADAGYSVTIKDAETQQEFEIEPFARAHGFPSS